MRVRFNINFEISPFVKRVFRIGVPLAIVLAGGVVYASVPHSFSNGDVLSAQNMNDDFTALDQRLAKLEALSVRQNADGGWATGATYCGATGNTVGDLSALAAAGNAYAKARGQCQSACTSATAHMCSGEEIVKSAQLGATTTTGWYSGAAASGGTVVNYNCIGWTAATAAAYGSVWNGAAPSFASCDTSYPVLCCD